MKKRIFSTLLAAVLILATLSACTTKPVKPTTESEAQEQSPPQNTDAAASTGSETLNVITVNDPAKLYLKDLIPVFESENKGIKVNLIEVPFDQFDSKIQTMLASKTPLDTTTHHGWTGFGARLANGQLLDLTALIEKYSYDPAGEGITQSLCDIWNINGKVYAIPVCAFPSILLYNKDMFDAEGIPYPPADYEDASWTWDKMVDIARKLTKNPDDPVKAQYGILWNWDAGGHEQIPQYFGHMTFDEGTFSKNMGFAGESYFDKPEIIADYQKVLDLTFKWKVCPTTAMNEAVGGNAFFAGKAAMVVDGGWIMTSTSDVKFNVGIAAIPNGGGDVRDVLWIDPYWIFKDSKVPDAAFKFIMFLTKTDTQKLMIEKSNGLPPANMNALDAYASVFKKLDPKDVKAVYEGGFKYGFEGMSHLMPDAASLNTLLTNEMGSMFNEGKPASTVLPAIQKKVQQYIADTRAKYGK